MPLEIDFITHEQIHDYVDALLSPEDAKRMAEFLRDNPDLGRTVETMRRHKETLQALYRSDSDDPVFLEVEDWIERTAER